MYIGIYMLATLIDGIIVKEQYIYLQYFNFENASDINRL